MSFERIVVGEVPRKHHLALRGPGGELRWEECFTREGFDGPYTIAYHLRRPHDQKLAATRHGWSVARGEVPDVLAKRHYRSQEVPARGGPAIDARVPLLFNDDVVLSVMHPNAADPVYFVNADADDLFYIHQGSGLLRSMLGDLRFRQGDYVFVPRGLLHRFIPDGDVPQYWLSIECLGGLHLLSQWRNEVGQLRMDAPYSHRDFRHAELGAPLDEGIRDLTVKRGGRFHGFEYAESPLDVIGWDGTVYPWAFPILAFQARAGLVHLPPTWHGTFGARGALICSFVPRMVDFHPEAIPCPYPHSSPDCDEVIFYGAGNFTSRRGVAPGSISHHPMGVVHGPHPGAYEGSIGSTSTSELAVMLDVTKPLARTEAAREVEDPGYQDSFRP